MSARKSATVQTRPYPVKLALKFNAETHRRQPRLQGAMWTVAAVSGGGIVGVAIVGHPQARMSCDGYSLEVLRVATDGTRNACSALYGACSRAALAMGALDLFTFIHSDESGHSLKAAGWIRIGESDGGEWGRPSRPRQLALDSRPKVKWAANWSRLAQAKRVA